MLTEEIVAAVLAVGYFAFSAAGIAFGIYVYRGRSAPIRLARYPIKFWLYAPFPIGAGFVLIGLAAGAGLLTKDLSLLTGLWVAIGAVGFLSIVVGLATIFVHPNWMRPAWLRGSLGD